MDLQPYHVYGPPAPYYRLWYLFTIFYVIVILWHGIKVHVAAGGRQGSSLTLAALTPMLGSIFIACVGLLDVLNGVKVSGGGTSSVAAGLAEAMLAPMYGAVATAVVCTVMLALHGVSRLTTRDGRTTVIAERYRHDRIVTAAVALTLTLLACVWNLSRQILAARGRAASHGIDAFLLGLLAGVAALLTIALAVRRARKDAAVSRFAAAILWAVIAVTAAMSALGLRYVIRDLQTVAISGGDRYETYGGSEMTPEMKLTITARRRPRSAVVAREGR